MAEASKNSVTPAILHIGLLESDPLRRVGYAAAFETASDLELHITPLPELIANPEIRVLMLGNIPGINVLEQVSEFRKDRSDLRVLIVGPNATDEVILRALTAGAKGYIDEAASIQEFLQAVRIVGQGSVWAPRRLLSQLIERTLESPSRSFAPGKIEFTPREKQVLQLLVAGHSNREIARAMSIEERTVKAHVAKLMRKVGVQNRIALTMHTINHALLGADALQTAKG
jgi:DNA-binding NarL/FixJ family response regulator